MARHRRYGNPMSTVLAVAAAAGCLLLVAALPASAAPQQSRAGYTVYKLRVADGPYHVLGYSNPAAIPPRLKAKYDARIAHDPIARHFVARGNGATASFADACDRSCTKWYRAFYGAGCNYGDIEIQGVFPAAEGKASLHVLFRYCAIWPRIGYWPSEGSYLRTVGNVSPYANFTGAGNFYNYNGQGPESGWYQQSFGTVLLHPPIYSSVWGAHIDLYLHAEGTIYVHMYGWQPR